MNDSINNQKLINIDNKEFSVKYAVDGYRIMNLIKIIIFLALFTPFMTVLSGCYSDSFLDAIKEEVDFIAPFDVVVSTEESKRTTYFPIADTGSNVNIAAGDDASYLEIPGTMNYEVRDNVNANGDDIVLDHTTGLEWTKCSAISNNSMDTDDDCSGSETTKLSDPALLEWSKAAAICKNLTYAGHKDWRLPRLPELLTIVNYGLHPAIDQTIFKNNRGDFEVPHYTKNHYSTDDRDRYMTTNGDPVTDAIGPADPDYLTARYIRVDGEYVFNESFNDRYKPDDAGDYILTYIPYNSVVHYIKVEDPPLSGSYIYIDYNSATHYNSGHSIDPGGAYILVSGNYIHVLNHISTNYEYVNISGEYILIKPKDRYNFDPTWGFGFNQSAAGSYLRVYIDDNEDQFQISGVDYVPAAGPYRRIYTPDIKTVNWVWSGFWKDYLPVTDKYPLPPPYQGSVRERYKFNGTKFVRDDAAGTFIQEFDSPVGYWTYTSKVQFDNNYNTADYGWIVFFQSGGTFGVNIASYKLKIKEDLSFEKQFVRCVRKDGSGDIDDADF